MLVSTGTTAKPVFPAEKLRLLLHAFLSCAVPLEQHSGTSACVMIGTPIRGLPISVKRRVQGMSASVGRQPYIIQPYARAFRLESVEKGVVYTYNYTFVI